MHSSQTHNGVQVRIPAAGAVTQKPARPVDPLLIPPELECLVEDGKMVSREQFAALAADTKLKSMLQNSSIQQVIREVDCSNNRERALELALDNPHFSALCSTVLDHISCNK
jgi:hypothetical protein